MISAEIMCRDAVACLGWPYVSPGSNGPEGIDCSGLFVYLFRLQGGSIYHGSNTIWREHTTVNKGKLTSAAQLKPGYAVFKRSEWKEADSGNRWYKKDNWGNMHHIGLVRSVNPLIIEHATSAGKRCVVEQRDLLGWSHYAELLGVDYAEGGEPMEPMIVTCNPGETVRLRQSASTQAATLIKIPNATRVQAGPEDDGWRAVDYAGKKGFMIAKFLEPAPEVPAVDTGDTVSITLPRELWEQLRDAITAETGVG